MRTVLLFAAVLAACAAAAPAPGAWQLAGGAPGDAPVFLQVAVKQRGAQWLADTLAAVADPDSPQYGTHPIGLCAVFFFG